MLTGMARRLAIGVAWWLAAAYVFQMAALMYGFPAGIAPLVGLTVAVVAAAAAPRSARRPADLRRIYQPKPAAIDLEAEAVLLNGR
jgi:hypothetical protein